MSERIKRYHVLVLDGGTHEEESTAGCYCRSTDVAAIEAENNRLRRIVEAAEEYVEALNNLGATYRVSSRPSNQLLDRLNRAKSAYDAAKAQATQQGEKAIDIPEPIGNCQKCGTAVYTREGFCGLCK